MRQWFLNSTIGIVLNPDNTARDRSLAVRVAYVSGCWVVLRGIDLLELVSLPFLAVFVLGVKCFEVVGDVFGLFCTSLTNMYTLNVNDIKSMMRVLRNEHGVGTILPRKVVG